MMPTLRSSPAITTDLPSMRREMDQIFNRFFGERLPELVSEVVIAIPAPLNMWEEGDKLCLVVDLAGVQKENLDVSFDEDTLRIVADRKETDENRQYWTKELPSGRIERTVTLPESVDPDSIDAELRDGQLHITLKKRPESQPKKVEVRA